MKKHENIIEGMTKRVIRKIVDQEVYEWPPQCAVFYYQPVRPLKEKRDKPANKSESKLL